LSRGSSPCGYPHEPLVSYQINRQLSGWILPPLVIRAFGAHCHEETSRRELGCRIVTRYVAFAALQKAILGPGGT
jgi:hypothetical protein